MHVYKGKSGSIWPLRNSSLPSKSLLCIYEHTCLLLSAVGIVFYSSSVTCSLPHTSQYIIDVFIEIVKYRDLLICLFVFHSSILYCGDRIIYLTSLLVVEILSSVFLLVQNNTVIKHHCTCILKLVKYVSQRITLKARLLGQRVCTFKIW